MFSGHFLPSFGEEDSLNYISSTFFLAHPRGIVPRALFGALVHLSLRPYLLLLLQYFSVLFFLGGTEGI